MILTEEEILDTILELSSGKIKLVAIFGSRARGDAHGDSDTDVAILTTLENSLDRASLRALLSSALNGPQIRTDIVTIEDVNWSMRYRIARDGKILYDPDDEWPKFIESVLIHYPDYRIYEEKFLKWALAGDSVDS